MNKTRFALLFAAVLFAAALPAAAQGFDIHGEVGYLSLAATDSAKAVFDGSTGGMTFGGGLGYRFRSGLYFEAGGRTFSKSGERVYVASPEGTVFKLGYPVDVKITPIIGTIGWRFLPRSLVRPYIGAGGGMAKYSEESDVAGDITKTDETKAEFHGLLGIEVGTGKFRFAVEGVYSTIPDALGMAGVSEVYAEKDAGGFVVLGRLTFTTSRR